MARPPNPETIAGLKKRVERLEELLAAVLEREGSPEAVAPDTRLRDLIYELNEALGLGPGTLEGRIHERGRRALAAV